MADRWDINPGAGLATDHAATTDAVG